MADEACKCGRMDWEVDDGYLVCRSCESGPLIRGTPSSTVQVARKTHRVHGVVIRPGDTYRRIRRRDYFEGGAWGPVSVRLELVSPGSGDGVASASRGAVGSGDGLSSLEEDSQRPGELRPGDRDLACGLDV